MTGTPTDGAVEGLPARFYTEEGILLIERDRMLWPSWQLVGHVSDLPASGTALRFDLLGRSLFVLRTGGGGLRAFRNACRHRGTRLIEGDAGTGLAFCVDGRVRCPYHGWAYDDSGVLVHVPDAEGYPGLDPSRLGLEPYEVAVWHGLIFVAPQTRSPHWDCLGDASSPPCAERFEPMRRSGEPRLEHCAANWKVLCEQWLDARHLDVAQPGFRALFSGRPRARGAPGPVRLEAEINGTDAPAWSVRAYGRRLRAGNGTGHAAELRWSRLFLAPNAVLDVFPDHLRTVQFLPIAAERTLVREVVYAHPDGSRDARASRYLAGRFHRVARASALRLAERTQRGLATSGHAGGPIAADEPALREFVERLRSEVASGEDGGKGRPAPAAAGRRRRRR